MLAGFADEPIRNRVMLALAYDAALRREELCSLRTDDLDPAHRTLRVRAETTKTRRERMVPYSAATGALLAQYLTHRGTLSRARGPLFLSESRRNRAEPLTLWTWSKVVRRIALAANVPQFSTHTTRHLCLTDLARMGWELHAIATFAGHRSTESTMRYIHLSGRELSDKLNRATAVLRAQRIGMLTATATGWRRGAAVTAAVVRCRRRGADGPDCVHVRVARRRLRPPRGADEAGTGHPARARPGGAAPQPRPRRSPARCVVGQRWLCWSSRSTRHVRCCTTRPARATAAPACTRPGSCCSTAPSPVAVTGAGGPTTGPACAAPAWKRSCPHG